MRVKIALVVIVLFLGSVCYSSANAQYKVPVGAFTNGGGVAGGGNMVRYSVGQMAPGIMSGSANIVKGGFWYQAGLSSAVDVAVTSFLGRLRDDMVVLEWVTGDHSFGGVNIYRAEVVGEAAVPDDDFVRLNEVPLSPETERFVDEGAFPGKEYVYRIGLLDGSSEKYSSDVRVSLPPRPLTLYQNYPNPFNPTTKIAYFLPRSVHVRLDIYDSSGRRVKTLVNGDREAGRYAVLWNGTNRLGRKVSSGIYFYKLVAGKKSITKKLVMVR
ncbi:MAG: hypothetical protein B6D63_05170 [Candidatus Latescibacteria bacterium 4484_7]|nr:MAG: hypothetical protein B6D63_05170 [Candidatus Latescibacteria bacterium 4484_7]